MDDLTLTLKHKGLSSSSASKSTLDLLKSSQSNRFTNSTITTLLSRNTASTTNLRESLSNIYSSKDNRKPVIYRINDNITGTVRKASNEISTRINKLEESGKTSDFHNRLKMLKKQYQLPKKYSKSKSNFEIQFEKEVKDIFEKKNIVKKFGDQTKIIKDINLYYNDLEKSANTGKRFINKPIVQINKPELKLNVNSIIFSSPIKLNKNKVINSYEVGTKTSSIGKDKLGKKKGISNDLENFKKYGINKLRF